MQSMHDEFQEDRDNIEFLGRGTYLSLWDKTYDGSPYVSYVRRSDQRERSKGGGRRGNRRFPYFGTKLVLAPSGPERTTPSLMLAALARGTNTIQHACERSEHKGGCRRT